MAEFKLPKPLLLLQRCDDCGFYRFPPSNLCPRCMSMNYQWTQASGKAKVFSWEVTHQAFYPAWDTPYNVTIVELEEGPRMHTNIVGCKNEDIYADMPLELVFEKVEDQDWHLPKFRPATRK
jgi:uncharacterized OB-fold protein